MKKWKIILLCSLLSILFACSSESTGNDETANSEESTETTEEANKSENEEENPNATPEMDFDMDGRVIKVVSWYDESIPDNSPDNIERLNNLEELKEKHNFDIEYITVDYGEYRDRATAAFMAGEPLGDIMRLARPWMIPTLTKQGMFEPVDEYVTNDQAFVLQYTTEHSQFEGRGYGFRIGVMGASSGIFYNRTLMDELGMDPLQNYVDDDNWNWDTFMEVARDANRDTDNDGTIDTFGLATSSLVVPALASNEANLVDGDQQSLDDPQTVEVLEFISKLETDNIARPTEGGDWTEPNQFFVEGNTLMYPGMDYEAGDFNEVLSEYDIGFLPFPKGPSASEYHTSNTIPNYYTIPSGTENPEQLVYLWEKIYAIDSIYDYPKQPDLETFFSNENDIENARMAIESMRIIEQSDSYPSMPYYEMVDELREGVSVSTVIETYKAPFQAAIDEIWNE
ncbi:ABC transporter substrate-binding protein [Alkalicoccobacillus porphyridii]|uniref:Extracellular solute-binding protein n=1 Tax=Alkalicoccobacillus porphyridii TaxID=2597270 RepID=A0A554A2F2_9BACI|nr:extracellular solute-binding protein [Alkalicoccobacillus porphyridii]TSB47869.1 extracellular solute-binding protein [Alkalicoccobacillus porphyridii]